MAYTERTEHKIEVYPPFYSIQDREAAIVEKDGVEVGRKYHRTSWYPGMPLDGACDEVKQIASALWTPEIVTAAQAALRTGLPAEN